MIEKMTHKSRFVRWMVPHSKEEIAFVPIASRLDNYEDIGKRILQNKQKVPIGDYTASFLYFAYCGPKVSDKPITKNVRQIMENEGFLIFNINLSTKNGIYVVQDENAIGMNHLLNINELEKKLNDGKEMENIIFSKDGKLRFAPKGTYKSGLHSSKSLAKDGRIIANCGLEGAEKLGDVSSKFSSNPYIWGVDLIDYPDQKVFAVDGSYGVRLWFNSTFGGSVYIPSYGLSD